MKINKLRPQVAVTEELNHDLTQDRVGEPEAPYSPRRSSRFYTQAREQKDSSRESQDAWVMTYMDLITLLLTLFIVLLAYQDKGTGEYQEVTKAMADATREILPDISAPVTIEPETPMTPLEILEADLKMQLVEAGLSSDIKLSRSEHQLDIEISEKLLFESAEADLTLHAQSALQPFLEVLISDTNYITVEGHTDNIPIHTDYFPSNWELSSARASSVVRHMIERGISPERLRAVGYAHTRPVADNENEEGRRSNRRVAIIISQVAS